MYKSETLVSGSYQLEIWLEDNAVEDFESRHTAPIQSFTRRVVENPSLANYLGDRRVLVRAFYRKSLCLWDFQFDFTFGADIFRVPWATSVHIFRSDTDAVMTAEFLASSAASQLQRLIPRSSEQIWEIRTVGDRSYLNIEHADCRIRMDVLPWSFNSQTEILSITTEVHHNRLSVLRYQTVSIDGIELQANVVSQSPCNNSRWQLRIEPRINRIEFEDEEFFSLPNPRRNRVVKVWTKPFNQEGRSPLPTRRTLQRTAVDGSELRLSAEVIQSDAEHEQHIRALLSLAAQRNLRGYIGDITCCHNAKSSFLRCAINPCGPCEGCVDYEGN